VSEPGRPVGNHRFLVDLGDRHDPRGADAGFSEVVFPRFEVEAGEPRLILRRGVTGAPDLYRWWDKARRGKAPARRSVRVLLLDEGRERVVMGWRFVNARPVALEVGALNANAPAVLVESIELAFDRMELER
jgi:phage tail-like protein